MATHDHPAVTRTQGQACLVIVVGWASGVMLTAALVGDSVAQGIEDGGQLVVRTAGWIGLGSEASIHGVILHMGSACQRRVRRMSLG
jgi:hypothetical protein